MTHNKTIAKKLFLILIVFAMFFTCSSGIFSLFKFKNVSAYAGTDISVANSNFNSNTSSKYPFSPNNWTPSADSQGYELKAGVINVDSSVFEKNKKDYNLENDSNPTSTGGDNYVLMINSKGAPNAYGYASGSFTLEQNSNYCISIDLKTSGYVASVYLTASSDSLINATKIENINAPNWQTYKLYVTTNDYESINVSLGLWLGTNTNNAAKGYVFFDNIKARKISNENLYSNLDSSLSNEQKSSSHKGNSYYYTNMSKENIVSVYDFSKTPAPFALDASESSPNSSNSDYTISKYTDVSGNYINLDGSSVLSPGTDLSYNNSHSLIIKNKLKNNVTYSGDEITLLPNRVYKFSIMAKVAEMFAGGGFVKLTQTNVDENAKSEIISSITSTSNQSTNGYNEYSIYVHSHPLDSTTFKMQIGLGTATEQAVGTICFTNFKISVIPYKVLSTVSSGNSKTIDLTTSFDVSAYFKNSSFDLMENNFASLTDPIYPTGVRNWTHSAGSSLSNKYGIVSTRYFDTYKNQYPLASNPQNIPEFMTEQENNNVLMLYNAIPDSQSTVSTSKELEANKYYKISVWVQTQLQETHSNGASVILQTSDSIVLCKVGSIKTSGWQRIDINIKTGNEAISVSLKLALGESSRLSHGYAFFDNAIVTTPSTDFETVAVTNYSKKIDLNDNLIYDDNSAPYLYTGTHKGGDDTARGGIEDLTKDVNVANVPSASGLTQSETANKVLYIKANEDTFYQYESKLTYTLASGNYYKIEISIFTYALKQLDSNSVKYDEDDKAYPFGATIALSQFDKTFTGIVSEGKWTTYTFFINPDKSTDSSLILALGNENAYTRGFAYFSNAKFTTFDDAKSFNASKLAYKQTNDPSTIIEVTTPIEETDDETDDKSDDNNINIWILIPSIITALAILIAVLGALLKKVKWGKIQRKRASNYDREKTVIKQMYRRQAIEKRDAELKEITADKTNLMEDKLELEKIYKENMNKLRSLKLKRSANVKAEVAALEKEIKHNTKQLANLGTQINRLELDINRLNSDAYLNELERQIAQSSVQIDALAETKKSDVSETKPSDKQSDDPNSKIIDK